MFPIKQKLFLSSFLLVLFCTVFSSFQTLKAQNMLVLSRKKGGRPVKFFEIGDKITFLLKDSDTKETGIIVAIEPTGFRTNGRLITFDSMAMVAETNKGLNMALGLGGIILGTGGLLLSPPLPIAILAVTVAGVGTIQTFIYGIRMMIHNRYKLDTKWVLESKPMPDE